MRSPVEWRVLYPSKLGRRAPSHNHPSEHDFDDAKSDRHNTNFIPTPRDPALRDFIATYLQRILLGGTAPPVSAGGAAVGPVRVRPRMDRENLTRVNPFFSNEKPGRRSLSSTSGDFGKLISKSLARANERTYRPSSLVVRTRTRSHTHMHTHSRLTVGAKNYTHRE